LGVLGEDLALAWKGGPMLKDLERELKRWREKRAQKPTVRSRETPAVPTATDRRTVRVNGQEVVVVKKGRKALA
jgi:hypothetical protein